ncbi:MAG TPA: hypothetical protein VF677_11860 [Flavobacterium sp.]|jgi:hypothetical protein
MTYKTLDTIPYKLFVKISETGDISLLSDTEANIEVLAGIWEQLYEEHLSKNQTTESKKILKLSKEIDSLLTLNKVVLMACECLKFDFDQELFSIIVGLGYQLSVSDNKSYYEDIKLIEREANAYIVQAENYKSMLPEKKGNENQDYNVDDVMASYSAILGFNIGDFNLVTYNAFYGYEKQVNAKIKALKINQK